MWCSNLIGSQPRSTASMQHYLAVVSWPLQFLCLGPATSTQQWPRLINICVASSGYALCDFQPLVKEDAAWGMLRVRVQTTLYGLLQLRIHALYSNNWGVCQPWGVDGGWPCCILHSCVWHCAPDMA